MNELFPHTDALFFNWGTLFCSFQPKGSRGVYISANQFVTLSYFSTCSPELWLCESYYIDCRPHLPVEVLPVEVS